MFVAAGRRTKFVKELVIETGGITKSASTGAKI